VAEHRYFADHAAEGPERERLGLIEHLADPWSRQLLATLGIHRGARCLEVGAGHGSMARWLAEQVGPQGRVVATDIDLRFLNAIQLPNVEVRQHDIRTDPLEPETYHLVHCRSVLMHIPEPHLVVRRMAAALRIGGWLVIEEVDLDPMRAVDAAHPRAESFNRMSREIADRIAQAKLYDPYLGRRVRGLLEDAGLSEIDNEGVSRITRGGEAHARQQGLSLQVLMQRGILSQAEYAERQKAMSDPSFSYVVPPVFSGWGKRVS
jgi:ubiquinone/menaquinone biosynthesis C-methylase UbiE